MVALNDRKTSRVGAGVDFSLAADEEGNVFVWGKKDVVNKMRETVKTSRAGDVDCKPIRRWRNKTIPTKLGKKEVNSKKTRDVIR